MRVVMDTNVLVSGIFFRGTPQKILESWAEGAFDLVMSPAIFSEYMRVVARLNDKFDVDAGHSVLELVRQRATSVRDTVLPQQVCEDPDDDKFLACAIEAEADRVVSGDRLLLATNGYGGVKVITPRAFLRELHAP